MTDTAAYRIIREAVGGERRVRLRTACATCGGRITPLHSNSIIYKHADPWSPCDGPIFEPPKAVPPAPRPRLLDLFCGAGGAAMGYHRAGFEVVGVDIKPQPNYPFEFHQADALDSDTVRDLLDGAYCHPVAAVHASPPCQRYIRGGLGDRDKHPDLLPPTRRMLERSGLPYVIENVPGAPMRADVMLCGSMFGLPIRRHRWFEASAPLSPLTPPCDHSRPIVGVYGHPHGSAGAWPGMLPGTFESWSRALGIDWMTAAELSQAIPPAYTQWIGEQLIGVLTSPSEVAI